MEHEINTFEKPEYRRSRKAYLMQCAFEYFVAILVSGSFLTKLLGHIGFSDSAIGIISSLITLACVFQLFSILIVQRIINTKKFAVLLQMLGRFMFMSLYLIPFLPFASKYKSILIVVCVLVAYLGYYLANSVVFKWGNSFVDPRRRGEYSAVKEMVSLILGMVVTLSAGYVMDVFEADGNLEGGFIFCAIAILIFALCDMSCLLMIKNEIKPKKQIKAEPMKVVWKQTLGNRSFRNIVILSTVYNIAVYSTVGFLGTYRLNAHELAFSIGAVELFNVLGSGVRFVVSKPFGRYSDRTSYAKGIELGMILSAAAYGLCIVTVPASRYLMVLHIILYSVSQAGTGQNFLNSTYSYVDSRYFVQATAIKNALGGICGFAASLLAGQLLEIIQENGNRVFGIPVYGQQVLAMITTVLILFCIIFNRRVVQKQEIMIQ